MPYTDAWNTSGCLYVGRLKVADTLQAHAGHRLVVRLRDARLPTVREDFYFFADDAEGGFNFRDDWAWHFEVFDPHGRSLIRGVREKRLTAQEGRVRICPNCNRPTFLSTDESEQSPGPLPSRE
jgi:hypothetical protein